MPGSFVFRQVGISAAAVLALALSACGGGGGGSPAELAAAPASAGGTAPVDGRSAAAGAPPGAGEGGGSLPVEDRLSVEPGAGEDEPGVPVGEGAGEGGLAAPGGGSASPSAAVWHVFGEVGTGRNGAALVTSGELAGVSAQAIALAAVRESRDGYRFLRYSRAAPYPEIDGYDESGLWRLRARTGDDLVWARADGGMTQSSRSLPYIIGSGDYDGVAVAVGHDALGAATYKLAYAYERRPSLPLESWTLDSEASRANVRKWSSSGGKGAVFRREDSGGSLWAAVTTDISGAGDTDWLATGMWAWTPADGDADKYRFGVFADGGEPFDHSGGGLDSNPGALTGVATYAGDASGVYTRPVDGARRTDFFEADVTLSADFSADPVGSGVGSISGSVSGFEVAGAAVSGNPVLTLNAAELGTQGSTGGSSKGTTSMNFDGSAWVGKWGSQFFGKDANEIPLSVAGTFGAAAGAWVGDGSGRGRLGSAVAAQAFVGAFGAYRTAYEVTSERPEPRRSWEEHSPFTP